MPNDEINLPVLSDELEDNYAGATMRLLTVHFGFPDPPLADTPDIQDLFRWEKPISPDDAVQGFVGFDGFWHPKRLQTTSFRGVTSPFFKRSDRGPIPEDI